jgi:hypothetical protein
MKVITWLGLCLLLFGPACQAANFAGNDTGSVSCPAELVDTVVERLGLPDLGTDLDQGEATPLVASTCKADPAQPGQTYVALAYDEGKPDTKTLILAIVERNRVLADYRGEISEDATLTLQPDSLRIDTAPYRLAKGVRAFGLDLSGWQSPNCGDGGTGPTRSLYIREGKHIRPVLTDLFLSSWRYIAQGQGRCNPMAPERKRCQGQFLGGCLRSLIVPDPIVCIVCGLVGLSTKSAAGYNTKIGFNIKTPQLQRIIGDS